MRIINPTGSASKRRVWQTLAGRGAFLEYVVPVAREGALYSCSAFLLALAAVQLWVSTADGVLELVTCLGLFAMDAFGIIGEVRNRMKDQLLRCKSYLGNFHVREDGGEAWSEISGLELKPGDVRNQSQGTYNTLDKPCRERTCS